MKRILTKKFISTTLSSLLIALPCVTHAAPPEGFENHQILNRGRGSKGLSSMVTYSNPAWGADMVSLEAIPTIPLGQNLLTIGGKSTVSGTYGDRTAYFGRFDWIIGPNGALSFKIGHEDWKYISTSKDHFGGEYTHFLRATDSSGIYFGFGAYYRLLRQRWNKPWWAPLNFNTRDREWYFTGVFGWKAAFTQLFFATFDINIRDAWTYYNLDHMAFDSNFYIMTGRGFAWKLNLGIRSSAVWVGTAYPAIYYAGVGFVTY